MGLISPVCFSIGHNLFLGRTNLTIPRHYRGVCIVAPRTAENVHGSSKTNGDSGRRFSVGIINHDLTHVGLSKLWAKLAQVRISVGRGITKSLSYIVVSRKYINNCIIVVRQPISLTERGVL
jgi:hypothetical protein